MGFHRKLPYLLRDSCHCAPRVRLGPQGERPVQYPPPFRLGSSGSDRRGVDEDHSLPTVSLSLTVALGAPSAPPLRTLETSHLGPTASPVFPHDTPSHSEQSGQSALFPVVRGTACPPGLSPAASSRCPRGRSAGTDPVTPAVGRKLRPPRCAWWERFGVCPIRGEFEARLCPDPPPWAQRS